MANLKLTEAKIHPEGWYQMKVVDIVEEDLKYGPTYKICLLSKEGDITALASSTYTTRSKFTAFVEAVLGEAPEDLDTDDLIGQMVGVKVVQKPNGYAEVAEFRRAKKGGKKDPFEDE